MNAKEKHQCAKRVYSGARWDFGGHSCGINATVEHDGKWYCKRHDPEQVEKRRAEKNAKWDRERAASYARIRLEEAKDHFCEGLPVEFMEQSQAKEWLIKDMAEGTFGTEEPC